ncbi:class I SAM-dependent methyltransferase [Nocardioides lentus]
MTTEHADHQHGEGHGHGQPATTDQPDMFEPEAWEDRYAGDETMWSGNANPQLVAEVPALTPGTALDVGCGEGGDVVWLARQGWRVTGADFAANGLARAARHAEQAGVAEQCDWWQVDARTFDPQGRTFDLVTTHFLHPPDAGMGDVVRRLATAVAPGGHLLVVGHAPSPLFTQLSESRRRAMWHAAELVPSLPEGFEVVVAEERPRTTVRDGVSHEIEDATLLARRVG